MGFLQEVFTLAAYVVVFSGVYKLYQAVTLLTEIRDSLKARPIAIPAPAYRDSMSSAPLGSLAASVGGSNHSAGSLAAEAELPQLSYVSTGTSTGVDPDGVDTSDADAYAESLLRSIRQQANRG